MHTGLNVRADYTFSHAIDNDSSTFNDSGNEGGGGLVLGYTDPWNHALDRGTSDFNQKHRVSSAIVWDVPFGRVSTGVAKTLGDNWTLSTTFDAQTGTPFSMFDCGYAITVCPRTSFVTTPQRKGSRLTDISSEHWSQHLLIYSSARLRRCIQRTAQPGCKYLVLIWPWATT